MGAIGDPQITTALLHTIHHCGRDANITVDLCRAGPPVAVVITPNDAIMYRRIKPSKNIQPTVNLIAYPTTVIIDDGGMIKCIFAVFGPDTLTPIATNGDIRQYGGAVIVVNAITVQGKAKLIIGPCIGNCDVG